MGKDNLTMCIRSGNSAGHPGYYLSFEYNSETVEALKNLIPHTQREWNPAHKVWWISLKYESALDKLFGNFDALAHKQGTL